MVNTHYVVDGHPVHDKDPNGCYKSLYESLDDQPLLMVINDA